MSPATAGCGRTGRPDTGSVTAELAMALPSVVLCLVVVLGVGQVVLARVQCVDAARAGARAAARGESVGEVRRIARQAGPPGTVVGLSREGAAVTVRVDARVRLMMPGVPAVPVDAAARAVAETTNGTADP